MRVALLLTLCLAGCAASVSEMRARPADLTAHGAGNFDAVAKCMANEVDALDDGGFGLSTPVLRFDDARKTAHLFRVFTGTGHVDWEVTFAQEAPGRVLIEARSGMPTSGVRRTRLGPLWAKVPRCALP